MFRWQGQRVVQGSGRVGLTECSRGNLEKFKFGQKQEITAEDMISQWSFTSKDISNQWQLYKNHYCLKSGSIFLDLGKVYCIP